MSADTTIPDISPERALHPRAQFFDEVGDICINADGIIRLLDEVEPNERTRAIKKAYRHRLAKLRLTRNDLDPKKMREQAIFGALEDQGFRLSFTKISGKFDD